MLKLAFALTTYIYNDALNELMFSRIHHHFAWSQTVADFETSGLFY